MSEPILILEQIPESIPKSELILIPDPIPIPISEPIPEPIPEPIQEPIPEPIPKPIPNPIPDLLSEIDPTSLLQTAHAVVYDYMGLSSSF